MKFAIAPSHQLCAEIIYYTDEHVVAEADESARPSQFNIWQWPNGLKGRKGFYVWTDSDNVGPYGKYFAATSSVDSLNVMRGGIPVRSYRIISGLNRFTQPYMAKK